MTDPIAIAVSLLALAVSATTAWLTLLRRGTVRMTQPTVIFFGPDTPRDRDESPPPKIYLRTLLFATSKRGRIIQSMHVSLTRNESHQNFNIWVYGDDRLVRGSGLFVGETGIAANHHFLTPKDGSSFQWLPGRYSLTVHAQLLGDAKQVVLFRQQLDIAPDTAESLKKPGTGLFFDWGPDSGRYLQHLDLRPLPPHHQRRLDASALPETHLEAPSPIGQQAQHL
jgi:hypothetical protein